MLFTLCKIFLQSVIYMLTASTLARVTLKLTVAARARRCEAGTEARSRSHNHRLATCR